MADENNRAPITPALRSLLGRTSQGEPLSNNRAPAPELAPWIARVYATQVEMEPEQVIDCGLLSDTAVLRVLFKGEWWAETADGTFDFKPSALFFGPQSKRMPARVKGSFATVTVSLKPGAVTALNGPDARETIDRVIPIDGLYPEPWCRSDVLIGWFDPSGPPERWLRVAEKLFEQLIQYTGADEPDPIIAAFDKAAFVDPNLSIADFAEEHDISVRQLERLIKSAFGLTPKFVLRRARALDMAAYLRGVADDTEAAEMALRYYDQSHLNREFVKFFGTTPAQFAKTPQPFMTLSVEARQARRLEVLGRNHPGMLPPWRR
jgi:AraC-like DNA-binding protein